MDELPRRSVASSNRSGTGRPSTSLREASRTATGRSPHSRVFAQVGGATRLGSAEQLARNRDHGSHGQQRCHGRSTEVCYHFLPNRHELL